ncbi:MAG: outer membrane protein transport protein [Nitrospirae bacterium]|nr:outer membrane protein transport protein [Nitrospirota bacterium]
MVSTYSFVNAQDQVEFSSTLNPVGSGARATGMGGAFIAVADDATAASWNPAGLIKLEKPEVSAVYSLFRRKQGYSSDAHPEIATENKMESDSLNYASVAVPFTAFNRNMLVSLNYQRLYEMNKMVDFEFIPQGSSVTQYIEFDQEGQLYAISPALAVQVTPEFYIGATLNLWKDWAGRNGWVMKQKTVAGNSFQTTAIDFRDEVDFEGVNGHLGFLWTINGNFTVGGVYKTAFDADLRHKFTETVTLDVPSLGIHEESPDSDSFDTSMEMPASYGVGLAYRHSDVWTVAFDIYRTDWSEFVLTDRDGNETNPVTREPISKGSLKDTTQIRLGTEYLHIRGTYVFPLRFGLFYDPEPAMGSVDDFYGISIGGGLVHGRIAIDWSYVYRTGNNTTGDIPSVKGSSADIYQHAAMVSSIFYFE